MLIKNIKKLIVICLAFSSTSISLADSLIYNTYNNHGIVGLINMPTARFYEQSVVGSTFYYGQSGQKITISSSPYDWMEASFFYMNFDNKEHGSGFSQDTKDKGFNIKLRIKEEGMFPSLAIGANDFAGTSFYSSEYIVSSYGYNNFDFHFGLGSGSINGNNSLKNPFIYLDDSFTFRSTNLTDQGSNVNLPQYYSDKSISPFYGFTYALNEKLIFKYERDSTKNSGKAGHERFETRSSYAIDYNLNNNTTLGLAFERDNHASLKFAYKKKAYNKKKTKSFVKVKTSNRAENKYDTVIQSLNPNGSGNYNEEFNTSHNSFGQVGLIQTPTADTNQEGSISFTFNKNDIWKFGTLSVSPFNWLEASYFYYRPSDLIWEGNNVAGHYLDKGFNVKFKYKPKNTNGPNLAIGLDDFAGTGYFTREYIVATQNLRNMKVTTGLGWGKFTGENSFENPLSFLSDKFDFRPSTSNNYDRGGKPSYDKWFRGNAALFGGLEYFVPNQNGLSIKLEYDPFDYLDFSGRNRKDLSFDRRKKDSNINIGISYPFNKFITIDASFIKGNTFNLSFTIGTTFNEQLRNKPKFNPSLNIKENKQGSKIAFYESILANLNSNNLFLQTANLKDSQLDVSISTSDYRNALRSSSYAASITKKVAEKHEININRIKISHINAGIELNNIKYLAKHINDDDSSLELLTRYTMLDSGEPLGFEEDEFKPTIDFPVIFSSISPTLVTHIGNPEKFFFGGINLQHISEIQFSRSLLLSTELNARVYGNFDNTISGPGSAMEHVRTDLVQYLKEDDIVISRMQLDYIWSPRKDTYAKLSGGIYETMFAGYGIETLYKPFRKNYSMGFEIFHVKQRSFDQRFSFKDYSTVTGHINFGYSLPLGIESNISYGRYLAKDDGFTFDLGRRTKSGFKAGIYFTRTNVSAETFGEGSFDKGFYFQIPMELFSTGYSGNYSTFKLSPLTRDGGAKLIHDKDLKGLIYNSTFRELSQQWRGLLN